MTSTFCSKSTQESLANTLLLLSQTQAKSAIALKQIVKLNPQELRQVFPLSSTPMSSTSTSGRNGTTVPEDKSSSTTSGLSHKDRLRAAVRGALGSKHPHEADLSDSQFLGRASPSVGGGGGSRTGRNSVAAASTANDDSRNDQEGTILASGASNSSNPVDEM
jgi:hypothetical protein